MKTALRFPHPAFLGLLLLAFGCGGTKAPNASGNGPVAVPASAKPASRAVITMAKGGQVELKLFPDVAPNTVENFAKLASAGFYNGLTFHRVEPGFVVQGGDPLGDGGGGPGYTIKGEFSSKPHLRGTLAMARTPDPDSAGSQFYICLAPAPFLDGKYAVFGEVTKGMEVVDAIKKGDKMSKVEVFRD